MQDAIYVHEGLRSKYADYSSHAAVSETDYAVYSKRAGDGCASGARDHSVVGVLTVGGAVDVAGLVLDERRRVLACDAYPAAKPLPRLGQWPSPAMMDNPTLKALSVESPMRTVSIGSGLGVAGEAGEFAMGEGVLGVLSSARVMVAMRSTAELPRMTVMGLGLVL